MENSLITGKAFVLGDFVSTYAIIPQRRWRPGKLKEEDLGPWALEDAVPEFKDKEWALRDSGATIVVAGKGFGGGGKSIEHPIYALKGAGVKLVLAESFGRYNYRNSIDKGLPVFECKGASAIVKTGDELTVDLKTGEVVDKRSGDALNLVPAAPFLLELLEAGGLLPYVKRQLEGRAR